MNHYMAGINIGSYKVTLCLFKVSKNNGLELIGKSYIDYYSNKPVKNHNIITSIKKCKIELQIKTGIIIKEAYLSLPSNLCIIISEKANLSLNNKFGTILSEDVLRVNEEVEKKLPQNLDIIEKIHTFYKIDFGEEVENPIGLRGKLLECNNTYILSKNNIIENFFCFPESSGISVKGIIPEQVAYLTIPNAYENNEFICVIDVGFKNTTILVFNMGKIEYSKTLNIGGNNINKKLSKDNLIDITEAEILKKKISPNILKYFGNNLFDFKRENGEVIKIRKDLIQSLITEEITYMLSIYVDCLEKAGYFKAISKVILIGDGVSKFDGIDELVQRVVKKPIETYKRYKDDIDFSSYMTNFALVASAFGHTNEDIFEVSKLKIY